ncbi:hypothetical protein ACLBWX_01910 [Methylobacterium sp. M6A4_1b]
MPAPLPIIRMLRLTPHACLGLALAGCVSTGNQPPPVAIVTDLAAVTTCAFIAPVGAPTFVPGARPPSGYEAFQDALRRRTAALGGTHLYLTNPSAGWGGASAIGSAYRCRQASSDPRSEAARWIASA